MTAQCNVQPNESLSKQYTYTFFIGKNVICNTFFIGVSVVIHIFFIGKSVMNKIMPEKRQPVYTGCLFCAMKSISIRI